MLRFDATLKNLSHHSLWHSKNTINPELVDPKDIKSPDNYNRFRDLATKDAFRKKLLESLQDQLKHLSNGHALIEQFNLLAKSIEDNGAVILGDLISKLHFEALIKEYTNKLTHEGSKSWIHSYINFGNHPDFLNHSEFRDAFLHPLLIALIAYAAGGPIRLVDARGKDAEPLAVMAQDNMLHIDNTPFRKEFKIILSWERGKASGPKGQNFVFIPGTHKGVRNCFVNTKEEAWSTEDASIFTTIKAVEDIFAFQAKQYNVPTVVEVSHPHMPLTTVFEAGALIHHRYRTKEKNIPRSCVILAFHRALDNPGQLLDAKQIDSPENSLFYLLAGNATNNTEDKFIRAILNESANIIIKLEELYRVSSDAGTKLIPMNTRTLEEEELAAWKKTVTSAPSVEQIKMQENPLPLGEELSHEAYLGLVIKMMAYDKHGPLDLILYADGHEEIRKWARNRIREMQMIQLERRLQDINLPNHGAFQLLTHEQLISRGYDLIQTIDSINNKCIANLEKQEKILAIDAYRSLRQLINDLNESIVRCATRQTFLSTNLFLFLASCELEIILKDHPEEKHFKFLLNDVKRILLSHYLATAIYIEKQIKLEKKTHLSEEMGLSKVSATLFGGTLMQSQEHSKKFNNADGNINSTINNKSYR